MGVGEVEGGRGEGRRKWRGRGRGRGEGEGDVPTCNIPSDVSCLIVVRQGQCLVWQTFYHLPKPFFHLVLREEGCGCQRPHFQGELGIFVVLPCHSKILRFFATLTESDEKSRSASFSLETQL